MGTVDLLLRARRDGAAIIGVGRSGLAAAEHLLGRGVTRLTLRDERERELPQWLVRPGVTAIFGKHYLDGLCEGVLIRSPGIRPDLPPLAEAVCRGALLTGEIGLFLAEATSTVLAITGSAGKTTTVALTEAMLTREGRFPVVAAGNNGRSPLPALRFLGSDGVAVLELSSFQLSDLVFPRGMPHRAAILNLSENHLNWHTDMAEYCAAKCRILGSSAAGVFPADDPALATLAARQGARLFSDTLAPTEISRFPHADALYTVADGFVVRARREDTDILFPIEGFSLPGRHNLRNLLAAVAMADGLASPEAMRGAAETFRGVRHRMERVPGPPGVLCINSSIDSTPLRTAATLAALDCRPIVLLGGAGKGLSLLPLADALATRASAVFLFGACGPAIEAALLSDPRAARLPIRRRERFEDAVRDALAFAKGGDTVLLSPASTSYDAFRDFEERGDLFREICREYS